MKYLTCENHVIDIPQAPINQALLEANIIKPYVTTPIIKPANVAWIVAASNGDNSNPYAVALGSCDGGGVIHTYPVLNCPEKHVWSHCGVNTKVPPDVIKRFYDLQKQLQD